jgi:adenylate cyclase
LNRPRFLQVGYIALGIMLVAAWLTAALQRADAWLLDHQLRWLREWRVTTPNVDVALIGIDDETVQRFPEPIALWHRHLAELLRALAEVRPAAVALDLVLPERSYDSLAPGYDRELIRGVVQAAGQYPLVLGVTVDSARHPRRLLPAIESVLGPSGTGLILWPLDADQRVRRFDEHLGEDGSAVPTLAGQLSRRLGQEPGRGIIDYSTGTPLDYIPMHTLLAAWQAGRIATLEPALAGKVVLVGPLFQFEDRKVQPVNLFIPDGERPDPPGLLLHAQALRNILGAGLIREVHAGVALALALSVALAWFVPFAVWRATALLAGGSLALVASSVVLMSRGVYVPVALALAALATAVAARGGWHGALTLIERRRLRSALAGYVSPQVATDVLAGKLDGGFEGRRYHVCVMFVDMRDFTPRSEATPPEQMIRLINECFEEMVTAVHAHGGTVMQFMGDGMMALFGAPNVLVNPSRAALQAAREIFARLTLLNAKLQAHAVAPVRIGVGLNTGEAIVGHVGARTRFGYSAVGDVVNVAARLEGLTKEVGHPVVCSEAVAVEGGAGIPLTAIGERAIKGHSPVRVYGWHPKNDANEG